MLRAAKSLHRCRSLLGTMRISCGILRRLLRWLLLLLLLLQRCRAPEWLLRVLAPCGPDSRCCLKALMLPRCMLM